MFDKFIKKLEEELAGPLPGRPAQLLMAPASRRNIEYSGLPGYSPRISCVLALFYPHEAEIRLLLILRPSYEGVHSGQVGFPGGKHEAGDPDFEFTALRETQEETGIDPGEIKIIGRLTELYIPPSNFLVYPFVGYCRQKPQMQVNEREVERVLEVNLDELRSPRVRLKKVKQSSTGLIIEAPYFELQGQTVWGATAMMVAELNELIKRTGF